MFGPFGGFEILLLLVLGLLIFGPRRLPEIGRTIGRAMMEFRRAAADLRTSIEREIDMEEVKQATRTVHREVDRIKDSIAGEVKRTLDEIDPAAEDRTRPEAPRTAADAGAGPAADPDAPAKPDRGGPEPGGGADGGAH